MKKESKVKKMNNKKRSISTIKYFILNNMKNNNYFGHTKLRNQKIELDYKEYKARGGKLTFQQLKDQSWR